MNFYHSFDDIAADLSAVLLATNAFKSVDAAAVSDHKGLLGVISNTRNAPKAFICIGDGEFMIHGLQRTFGVSIVVYSDYKNGESRKADAVWNLVAAACIPFLPVVVPGSSPVFPAINGVEYELQGWTPIATGGNAAFAVELKALEALKYTVTNP